MDSTLQPLPFGSQDPNRAVRSLARGSAVPAFLLNFAFGAYKLVLGPALLALGNAGYGCRFEPSCSTYAREAFGTLPFFEALRVSAWRLLRCNPWNSSTEFVDPVPSHSCRNCHE